MLTDINTNYLHVIHRMTFPCDGPSVCLVVFIGLPAAGKSRLCELLVGRLSHVYTVQHVCFDTLIDGVSDTVHWDVITLCSCR
jgi:hypothetical protein